ncbi:MAG: CPBP family intramembrane glutamic endopeptidase [Promethearchaeota archaeon]|jgi:membrane protease YdiL (CAAX protease family)
MKRKYIIIVIVFLLLTIPMFFGIYVETIFREVSNLYAIIILFGGLVVLLLLGEFTDKHGFNIKSLEAIKDHDVIQSLTEKENRGKMVIMFIITMIMEELIFRYYLISFLFNTLDLSVLLVLIISSLFFSLYHIHTWFTYKNIRILGIFLINSFLLGLFLGYIFLNLGFLYCIVIHSIIAFLFYFNLVNRYFKKN